MQSLIELGFFSAKLFIVFIFILALLSGILALLLRNKNANQTGLSMTNLNEDHETEFEEMQEILLDKKEFKSWKKKRLNQKKSRSDQKPYAFVLEFNGDMEASQVDQLREEITAILRVASTKDCVILKLESPGGAVHGYGLAASQLMRIREKHIKLIACVDKVAASGGYLMACVANKIIAAPFAIIGSIGVIVQLPNFYRFLRRHEIDFEQHTAGEFKRTISLFGENTDSAREKLQEELESIHSQFKNWILENRKNLNLEKVATGEHWLAKQALDLHLIDELCTSDDYIQSLMKNHQVYEVKFEIRKTLLDKISLWLDQTKMKLMRKF